MPKTAKKTTAKKSKSYPVIVLNADIRQQRGKRAPKGQAKESRETKWPTKWQALIESVGGTYITLAQLWDVSHMKVYRWGVEGREPSTLEKWGIREFCRTRNVVSPV
jgi:hypothetical protein